MLDRLSVLSSHYSVPCSQKQTTHVRLDFCDKSEVAPQVVVCVELGVCSAVNRSFAIVDWCAALHEDLRKWMILSHYCSVNYN